MFEKYYTTEQLKELRDRGQAIGEERIRQAESEWLTLMEQVQAEMDKGTEPSNERVLRLAWQWMALVGEFTGGNPQIEAGLTNMYETEQEVHGMDTASMRLMMEYISAAAKVNNGEYPK